MPTPYDISQLYTTVPSRIRRGAYRGQVPGDDSLPPLMNSLKPINAPTSTTVGLPAMAKSTGGIKAPGTDYGQMLGTAASQIAPFASNIANSFRKPPKAPVPKLNNKVTLRKINMNNDRAMVERGIRGSNANVDRTLDENTAAAVKSYNLAQRYNQLSGVNQTERNANTQTANQEVLTNASIDAGNNQLLDQYGRDKVERTIAQQREQSQNLSNASDKYQAIQNEKAKVNLDVQRFGIISSMYNRNGVAGRTFKSLNEAGIDVTPDYYGADMSAQEQNVMSKLDASYKKNRRAIPTTFKMGGRLRPIN